MSVEELQKAIAKINKDKVNLQEPPSHTKIATSGQQKEKVVDTFSKVDSTKPNTSTVKEQEKEKTRQHDTSVTTTQSQGAPPLITIIHQSRIEENKEEIPKEKEQEAIQTLINFPITRTLTSTQQHPSTEAIPL